MQIKFIGHRVRGFGRITDYAIRWTRMITDKAKHKARVLNFWAKHGLPATVEAFKARERTLYLWKSQLQHGDGKLEALNEKPKRPKRVRRRIWTEEVRQEIRRIRTEHPNLGKEKIHPFLQDFCNRRNLKCPQPKTIGRIIADAPDKMRIFPTKVRHNGQIVQRKRAKRLRKPKHFTASHAGHCGSFDTIEKFVNGCRRYVLTFTDVFSRFSFALATNSHASLAAKEFFTIVTTVFPFQFEYILTDNGSEFMKHFDQELRRLHKTHWHTYPKTPKMNAHCERFNRTIQEEFIDYHESELFNPDLFNQKLIEYLLWYNGERPHWSLNLKSPIQFLTAQNPKDCKIWWPYTTP